MGRLWRTTSTGKRVRTAEGVRHEYERFQSSTRAKKERASRNKARRREIAAGNAHKGDGRDVHHVDGNPMDDARSNLRVEKASTNRGHAEESRLKGSKRDKSKWGAD